MEHEIINEGAVCGQKRDAVFAPPPASYKPAVVLTNRLVGLSLASR